MLRKLWEVSDAVSLALYCPEDGSWCFVSSAPGEPYRFITVRLLRNNWKFTAFAAIRQVLKCDPLEVSLVKVLKRWYPDGERDLYHAHFRVNLSLESKRNLKSHIKSGELTWLEDMDQLVEEEALMTPEIAFYLPEKAWPSGYTDKPFLPQFFDEDSFVIEIARDDVIVNRESDDPFDQLVFSAQFTEYDETRLYEQFLAHAFPYATMGPKSFAKFISNFGWSVASSNQLFQAADLDGRGALLPRELLYLMSVLEPGVIFTGPALEMRAGYIFRFFDFNKDGFLDSIEFRSLIFAIGSGSRTFDMDGSVDQAYTGLGVEPGTEIELETLVSAVARLKLKGTSSVLVNHTKLSDFLGLYESKADSTVGGKRKEGKEARKALRKREGKICSLASHKIKIGCRGILTIDNLVGDSLRLGTSSSYELMGLDNPANKLLLGLNYFTRRMFPSPSDVRSLANSIHVEGGDSILGKPRFAWGQITYSTIASAMLDVCVAVVKILKAEPRVLELESPVYIFGDLHGNFKDLYCYEKVLWKLGMDMVPGSFLFLGDFVDRGSEGLEVVTYLFAQKLKNPKRVFLIRGSHELRPVQKGHNFYDECMSKLEARQGEFIWESINIVFDHLPLAARIDGQVFCCHGGIPPPWLCPAIEVINMIPCPLETPEEQSALAWSLLWNDAIRKESLDERGKLEMNLSQGFMENRRLGTCYAFGGRALRNFLLTNGLSHVVKAHQPHPTGYSVKFKGKLISVFSSSYCTETKNEAAVLLVLEKAIRVINVDTSPYHPIDIPPDQGCMEE